MELVSQSMMAAIDIAAYGSKIGSALMVVLGIGLVIFFHELVTSWWPSGAMCMLSDSVSGSDRSCGVVRR